MLCIDNEKRDSQTRRPVRRLWYIFAQVGGHNPPRIAATESHLILDLSIREYISRLTGIKNLQNKLTTLNSTRFLLLLQVHCQSDEHCMVENQLKFSNNS